MKNYIVIQKVILSLFFSLLLFLLAPVVAKTMVFAEYSSSINIPSSYVNIGIPHGMAMAADGDIWYVDTLNVRLVKFDPDTNTIIRTVGRLGTGEGEFDPGIYDLTIDSAGYIYIISHDRTYIYKLDSNGGFIGTYDFGGLSGGNALNAPRSITYDAHSNSLFVSNTNNHRILKFTTNMTFVSGFGSSGTGQGQFSNPWGVATDSAGKIYVADEMYDFAPLDEPDQRGRVQVFNPDYTFDFEIKTWEVGTTQYFVAVKDIVVLTDGTITVSSQNSNRVVQFDDTGDYIRTISGGDMTGPEFLIKDDSNNFYVSDWGRFSVSKYSSTGTLLGTLRNSSMVNGKLYFPADVAFDGSGYMYILDAGRVLKYTSSGTYDSTIIADVLGSSTEHLLFNSDYSKLYISNADNVKVFTNNSGTWSNTSTIGSAGTGNGEFVQARGMAFDAAGNLYVVDNGNKRVEKFTAGTFAYESQFGGGWVWSEQTPAPTGNQLGVPHQIVIDSTGLLYVADEYSVKQYNTSGILQDEFVLSGGGGGMPKSMTIYDDEIFVSYQASNKVVGYDPNGTVLHTFGTKGGGQVQFAEPWGLDVNPLTDSLAVCDSYSSRIEYMTTGTRIFNLIPSANVISLASGVSNGQSLSDRAWVEADFPDWTDIPARLIFGDYIVADFHVDLSEERDWSAVNVITLPFTSKALVVNLSEVSAPGIYPTHSLYVYRYANQTTVNVCPEATTMDGVIPNCPSEITLTEGSLFNAKPLTPITGLAIPGSTGKNYWRIDELTGTGAFSSLFTTTFDLQDLMTRQQISTTSNHQITFGTSYDITHLGDTITIGFSDDWDMSDISFADLGLYRGATALALVDGAADTDLWGVAIDNTSGSHSITFTAPINTGSTEYISQDTVISVWINNAVFINPSLADTYRIDITMITDDENSGQNSETGSINIPIVDSDQVDITGYVNNYIVFDIDTTIAADPQDCDPDTCKLHGGTSDPGLNYTVDLGELNASYVNKSEDASVRHSDGEMGLINSIYLDLTSNAISGTVVKVYSANEALNGPSGNTIPVVDADGDNVIVNSGTYGFTMAVGGSQTHGSIIRNENCSSEFFDTYCAPLIVGTEVFNTDGVPLDAGRLRVDLAAAAAYTNNPGTYTDTLTFVATGTF